MGKSLREKAVMATFGVIILYMIAVGTWFLSAEGTWKKAAAAYVRAKDAYRREVKLIGEKKKWTEAYESEKKAMPACKTGPKDTISIWGPILERIAATNHVSISGWQAREEVEAGEVFELPIELRGCEGSLQSLVHLMYELENSEEGMFDISEINIKPISSKPGYLRADFTLNCAYMREK